MFQCIKYEDKREVFGLKIHSFSTLDRIKKYDDSDNEKNAEKRTFFSASYSGRRYKTGRRKTRRPVLISIPAPSLRTVRYE